MTRRYIRDHQRKELWLPAYLLLNVLLAGAEVRNRPYRTIARLPTPFEKRHELIAVRSRRFRILPKPPATDARPASDAPTATERQTYAYRMTAYQSFLLCKHHLEAVNLSVTEDLMPDKRRQLLNAIERMYRWIIEPYLATDLKKGEKIEKFGLIAFYFLQILVTENWIVVGEDSDLQKALDILLPGLDHIASVSKIDASAQKQARQVFEKIQQRERLYV